MIYYLPAMRFIVSMMVLVALAMSTGCGKELRTDYGKSRGITGDQSINGFGILRRSYENSGWTTREVNRLNQRLSNVDAIVWLPQYRDAAHEDACEWFEQWLAEDSRTLVYVVPDDGCEIPYLKAAQQLAPSAQRLAYRRRIARLESDQLISRLNDESTITTGWFAIERLPAEAILGGQRGEWTIPDAGPSPVATQKLTSGDSPVAYKVIAAPASPATTPSPSSPSVSPSASASPPAPPASGPGNPASTFPTDVQHSVLLSARDGSPVVVRLTADRWGDSKLIVVGSGSLLCNFSMTTLQSQAIASQLIAETGTGPGIAGFMTTDYRGAVVSNVDPEINKLTGMELLTVWPINLIVLHLAVTGFVACMVLMPIFGRPREPDTAPTSDFADHLDAVAALMSRSGGEEFARRRVSDYMKRIRGETTGPWILPETKAADLSAAPAQPTVVHSLPTDPALPMTKAAP